jgi:hypothetical protein
MKDVDKSTSTMIRESFDCQICFELFEISGKHEPCVVDCGHTLCCECVTRLKSLRGAARCPFCKFPITPHRVFPKNYSLLDAMSSYHDSLTVATNTNAVAAADSTAVGAPPPDEALESASNEVSQCVPSPLPPSFRPCSPHHPSIFPPFSQPKERRLLEKTIEEYKDQKLVCDRNQSNLSNYTTLLNQTRAQLQLLERLNQQAQQDFDSSQSKLNDLRSVLQFLQLSSSSKHGVTFELPPDIPAFIPEEPTPRLERSQRSHTLSGFFRFQFFSCVSLFLLIAL